MHYQAETLEGNVNLSLYELATSVQRRNKGEIYRKDKTLFGEHGNSWFKKR